MSVTGTGTLATWLLAISLTIQILAAGVSISLARGTRWWLPWLALTAAFLLMTLRRATTLIDALGGVRAPDLTTEIIALAISILVLLAVLTLSHPLIRLKAAEAGLRQSERRFQDIAEVSGDWIWETDREHRFTVLTGERTATLPVQPGGLFGRTRWEVAGADPETNEDWVHHKANLDAHQPFRRFRYSMATPTGELLFISASGKPVFDDAQNFTGYRGTATDETDTVEATHRANVAEALLGRIFETSLDLIVVTDRSGTLLQVSPSVMPLLGYDPGELVGRSGSALVHPDDLDATRNEMRKARQTGAIQNFECRYIGKDDAVLSFWWKGVWSASDQQHFFIGRDVTERKAAEHRLAEVKNRLAAIIEAAPLSIFMLDPSGNVLLWTASAERLFGYTAEEAVGGPPPYLDDKDLAEFRDAFARTVAEQSAGFNETRRRCRDGTIINVSVTWAPVHDEDGTLLGIMYAIADVTERKKLESRLQQAQKMEAIGTLTGGLAHDFNNHLGVIILNLDILRELPSGSAEAEELTRDAMTAAMRGAELIRRLLAFARRQPLQAELTDINALVGEIAKLLQRTLGEEFTIAVELSDQVWPSVIDPAQLEASLLNLATNARDAMLGGGRLTITTANRQLDDDYTSQHVEVAAGEYAMIEVSDNGQGMSPDLLAKAFEPFFTTKAPGKGTGLGLSMVYGFIKQSGGHINIYSEVGVGTTVRLYLPRAMEGAAVAEVVTGNDLVRGHGQSILAVEDNAGLRRAVVRQLSEIGYRVIEADDAQKALAILKQEPIALLFSDVVLPGGMSGYELAREAAACRPDLKIVLTSGFPENSITDDGKPPNLRLLTKPYRKEEIARIIGNALAGKEPV